MCIPMVSTYCSSNICKVWWYIQTHSNFINWRQKILISSEMISLFLHFKRTWWPCPFLDCIDLIYKKSSIPKVLYLVLSNISPNYKIVLYQNQTFIKHFTEDAYHINLDISHHCLIAVFLWHHKNGQILAISPKKK